MKVYEFASCSGFKSFVAQVRYPMNYSGSSMLRFHFECDSLSNALAMLSKLFGKNNVLSVRENFGENAEHPVSSTELQVKSLNDKAKQLKQQAKLAKARNRVLDAQRELSGVTKASI